MYMTVLVIRAVLSAKRHSAAKGMSVRCETLDCPCPRGKESGPDHCRVLVYNHVGRLEPLMSMLIR